jgi:hypothetical protein
MAGSYKWLGIIKISRKSEVVSIGGSIDVDLRRSGLWTI